MKLGAFLSILTLTSAQCLRLSPVFGNPGAIVFSDIKQANLMFLAQKVDKTK